MSNTTRWRPYPEYKDSSVEWLGEIPAHWEVKRLKFLAEVRTGTAKGRDFKNHETIELPYLRVANVQDGYLDLSDIATITVGVDEIERYLLKDGDVLMNEGGDFDKLGRGYVWHEEIPNCVHQNHVFAVRPNWGVNPYWLNTITLTSYAKFYFILRSKQSTNLASISSSNLKELPVLFPPKQEQDKILVFVSQEITQIDTLIAKKQRLIDLLQEKRAALISHVVTKGLDPAVPMKDSGVEWLGEIPAHWEVKRLKFVVKGGLTNGIFKKKDQFGSGTKLINVFDIYRKDFLVDFQSLDRVQADPHEQKLYSVLPGDIFFVRSSLKLEGVAASVCAIELPEPTVFECHLVRIRPYQVLTTPKYLISFLNSSLTRQRLISLAETTTMTTISQPKLASLEVIVPPFDEQCAIATYLDQETAKIDALIAKMEETIEKLQEYRTALISAAVTGKIDVRGDSPDAQDERIREEE